MGSFSVASRIAGLALVATSIGCSPRIVQQELGTPSQRWPGHTLVLLPRTCVVERAVPAHHLRGRTIEPASPRTTARLRRALDSLVAETYLAGDRSAESCSPPPDLGFETEVLSELRASDETLRIMRDRGATHAVVLEVFTVMACVPRNTFLVARLDGFTTRPWSPEEVCVEDEVTLSAFVFRDDGSAVFALTREIGLDENSVPFAVDRVLERVPVSMPARPRPRS